MFAYGYIAIADSPHDHDELTSKSYGSCDVPRMSNLSSETSAVGDVRSAVLASSSVGLSSLQQSNMGTVRTSVSDEAPMESATELTVDGAAVTLDTSLAHVRTHPCHEEVCQPVVQRLNNACTPEKMLPMRNEVDQVQQSSFGIYRSIDDDLQGSSPEIDVLPVVKRVKTASDYSSVKSSTESAGKQSLQLPGLSVHNDDGMSSVEPTVTRPSVYRCGSPGLDEDGEFSRHRLKPDPAALTHFQSNTASGVKLILLSQVVSTGISSDAAKTDQDVDKTFTTAADNKVSHSQETESAPVTKVRRRQSKRLRVPKSARLHAVDRTKAVTFCASLSNAEPTNKENVSMQITNVHLSPQKSAESVHPSAKSPTNSCNSPFSGKDAGSDVNLSKVRRPVKRIRQSVEPVNQQRLPIAWERHTNGSPGTSRRISDRIKQKETSTQANDCQKSPPTVTGRKRSASSSSSGLSSCEKKSSKKSTCTIAMTSLHTEWVTFLNLQFSVLTNCIRLLVIVHIAEDVVRCSF